MIQAAKTQATMPETAQEPTMEEILASIRRIIADDDIHRQVADVPAASQEFSQVRMSHQAEAAVPARRPERVEAVAMIEPVEPASSAPAMENRVESRAEGYIDSAFRSGAIFAKADAAAGAETAPEMMPQAAPAEGRVASDDLEATVRQLTASMNQHLLSANTAKAVDSAFQVLAQNVLAQNARTLEDLVQDMLRPLLKSWLDDNLPTLVERLVRAEIERVSRGRVS